ncbi:MAG: MFS transporter [Peptococcaceae bacterium]|jgi:MFS family permease|nr:MFS transporter [Peptococcaceae bacterium]
MSSLPLWKRNLLICWIGSFATTLGLFLVIPFLPLYVEQLGIHSLPEIATWTGYTLGIASLTGALTMPFWGKLSDKYGCRPMLLRASLGIAITTFLMGFSQNIYHLLILRLLMGCVMGYIPAAITMIAAQTPKEHTGWALGMLSTGGTTGTLIGPLLGGFMSDLIGLRPVFFVTGFLLFLAFLITFWGIHEERNGKEKTASAQRHPWKNIAHPQVLIAIFLTTFMLQLATMSIQPILMIYVEQLLLQDSRYIAMISGAVFASTGIANLLVASRIGRISDRIGARKVLIACLSLSVLTIVPQAFVHNVWQLGALRFLMGMTTAGLMPSINTMIRRNIPGHATGVVYGYNTTSSNLGNMAGPVLGGHMAAAFGIPAVFFSTGALLLLNTGWVLFSGKKVQQERKNSTAVSPIKR